MSGANFSNPHSRYERIYENCRTIWGDAEYRVFYDDEGTGRYQAFVKKVISGSPQRQILIMTFVRSSIGSALIELDRMLGLWAKFTTENGQTSLTSGQMIEVFGGTDPTQQNMAARFWGSKHTGLRMNAAEKLLCLQQRMGELQAEMEALEMEMLSCVEENV